MACRVLRSIASGLEKHVKSFGELNMLVRHRQMDKRKPRVLRAAFTLIEVLISAAIMAMTAAGIVYGYAQANRFAEWSSMSLAAQSYALQGLEQVRSAKWDFWTYPVTDLIPVLPPNVVGAVTNFSPQPDIMDVPVSGAPYYVTNYISLKQISLSPQLREVKSQCVWIFPRTGQIFTNTVITYRAPDHQ
jgi:prepilin-type N-terminal cleavage/methylation domain-containing protein